MEEIKYIRYNNWLLRNALSLIGFPFTILALVIGLYGDVVDDFLSDPLNNYSDVLPFFEKQKHIAENENRNFKCEVDRDSITYNHLLIIDRTASTVDQRMEDSTWTFQEAAYNYAKEDFNISISNKSKFKLKNWILLNYLQVFINSEETSNVCISYYDGIGKGLSYPKYFYKKIEKWVPCNEQQSKILLASTIGEENLFTSYDTCEQKTYFDEMFNCVKALRKTNIILSIISDFNNDGNNMSSEEIRNICSNNNLLKINLIYIPSTVEKVKKNSDKFINNITENLDNDVISCCEIDFSRFENSNCNSYLFDEYILNLTECFTKYDIQDEKIEFDYPLYDFLSNTIVKRKISFESESDSLSWRISSEVNCKETFRIYSDSSQTTTSTYDTNEWEQISSRDTLELLFFTNSDIIETNLHLDILDSQNGNIQKFKIVHRRFIPKIVSIIAYWCLYAIIVLFVVIIGAHIYEVSVYANKNLYQMRSLKWLLLESIIFLIIGIVVILLLYAISNIFHQTLYILSIVAYLIVIVLIWLHWYNIKKQKRELQYEKN